MPRIFAPVGISDKAAAGVVRRSGLISPGRSPIFTRLRGWRRARMTEISPEFLALLACPVPECHGPLELRAETLHCPRCRAEYRLEHGWPVLIPEEATPAAESR
jgi:uncharacterized protein YbaR (Trm112 family)